MRTDVLNETYRYDVKNWRILISFWLIVIPHPKTNAYGRVCWTDQDLEKSKADILQVVTDKGLGPVEWIGKAIRNSTLEETQDRLGLGGIARSG